MDGTEEKREPTPLERELQEIVERQRPEIERQLADQVTKRVTEALSWSLENAVSNAVKDYITKTILPEVEATLAVNRDHVIASIVAGVEAGAGAIGANIAKKIESNAGNSYKLGQIIKAMVD